MLKIDRMEIEDAGGNPAKLAAAIIRQLPDLSISIPVRDIAEAIDIYEIREEKLVGLEGGLIAPKDKSEGSILVHSERPETRKRYTIAHELGHYVNPWHKSNSPEGFRCRPSDLRLDRYDPTDRAAKMEVEANEFAAELLMPPELLSEFLVRNGEPDIGNILRLAKRFHVSREAAARRYVSKHTDPLAVIFSKDKTIRYIKRNFETPRLAVWSRHPLPSGSLSSADSISDVGQPTSWEEVDEDVWLEASGEATVYEQTLAQQNGFRMTLLSIEIDASDGESDHWEAPTFHR